VTRLIAAALVGLALLSAPSRADSIADARAAVAAKLKDPASARFENIRAQRRPNAKGEIWDVVCGNVAAKNSFGGYASPAPFAYIVPTRTAFIADGAAPEAGFVIERFCR